MVDGRDIEGGRETIYLAGAGTRGIIQSAAEGGGRTTLFGGRGKARNYLFSGKNKIKRRGDSHPREGRVGGEAAPQKHSGSPKTARSQVVTGKPPPRISIIQYFCRNLILLCTRGNLRTNCLVFQAVKEGVVHYPSEKRRDKVAADKNADKPVAMMPEYNFTLV